MAMIVAGLALIARSYRKAAGASAAAKRFLAGRLTQNGAPDGRGFAATRCCAGAGERAEVRWFAGRPWIAVRGRMRWPQATRQGPELRHLARPRGGRQRHGGAR